MPFPIYIPHSLKLLKLEADCIYVSDQVERFKVSGKNRYVILQNNYPIITDRMTGRQRGKAKWKLIEGSMSDAQFLINIIRELEYYRRHQ